MAKTIKFKPQVGALNRILLQEPNTNETDFVFDRNGKSTVRDESGFLKNVDANLPRFNFRLDKKCPSLLIEPLTKNEMRYSEDFSVDTFWTKTNGFILSDVAISPRGTLNADKFVQNKLIGLHFITHANIPSVIGSRYFSIYAKKGESYKIAIKDSLDVSGAYVSFDLKQGVVLDEYIAKGYILDEGNDWYRIVYKRFGYNQVPKYEIIILENNYEKGSVTNAYLGDGKSGLYLWGAQSELGYNDSESLTSYIPTLTNEEVIRSKEEAVAFGMENYINDNEGVLFMNSKSLDVSRNSTDRYISLSDGTINNRVCIYYDNYLNTIKARVQKGIIPFNLSDIFFRKVDASFSKIAFRYKENNISLWVDGFKVDEKFIIETPIGLNQLRLDQGNGRQNFEGEIAELWYDDKFLTDVELEENTSYSSFKELADNFNYTIL